jgi:hypothetical protein
MTTCGSARPAPLQCPTLAQMLASALQLLPLGRAWQSNEGGPAIPVDRGFDGEAFNPEAFSTAYKPGSTLWKFWQAVAGSFAFTRQRLCDLRFEFFCATRRETDDLWMAEYGLPDACDPFPDLCTKVAAIGGTRCEYYAEVAARAGWSIACERAFSDCGSRVGCRALAGRAKPGRPTGFGTLVIRVFVNESPAYQPIGHHLPPFAGRLRAGRRQSCGPDLTPLQCLLSRILHADIKTIYEVN